MDETDFCNKPEVESNEKTSNTKQVLKFRNE